MTTRLRRRSFLAGAGTLLALPAFESLLPREARAATPATTAPVQRFMTFHFPIGVNRASWKPGGTETSWTLGASQVDLAPYKDALSVITGVNNSGQRTGSAGHTCNLATFLTGNDVPAGIHSMGTSADQMIANVLASKTRFRSLELGTSILNENPNAEAGYDPVLKDHLSWSNGTPLPKEINPSALFDRLFAGGTSSLSAEAAARRRHFGQSVIDAVRADGKRLRSRLGQSDGAKLDEYLAGVRDLELSIQSTAVATCSSGTRPGPPADVRDRVKQMLDLSVLAFSCDLTRVITFGYEHTVTEQSHPWLGVTSGYHIGVTHNDPGKPYAAVNQWIVSQLAYLLGKLEATPDAASGTGTLLDNSIVYFASELGEGSSHSGQDIPIIVAGRGGGRIPNQGRLLARSGQGNGNVLIALMQAMGVTVTKFGNGFTTPLPGLVG